MVYKFRVILDAEEDVIRDIAIQEDATLEDLHNAIVNAYGFDGLEVASFYTMFNLKPVGKCVIEVCRTGPCWLMGAEDIVKYMEKKLGIREGETTPDGMFTLKTAECLASCGTAPMMQIGEKYHENLTLEKVDTILDDCRTNVSAPVSHWAKDKIKP